MGGYDAFPEPRFLAAPKAELHVHLEGSVMPETLLALAREHGVEPPGRDAAAVRAWYSFPDFARFLERYRFVCSLLRRAEDFRRIARDYLLFAHAQGTRHVELHVSSTYHVLLSNVPWSTVLEGALAGCDDAERACGISSLLIPDLSPELGPADCGEVVEQVLSQLDPRVAALGMGGEPIHWMENDFTAIFERARAAGLHAVVHAGEHSGAEEVRRAVEELGAERIQHGIGALEDPQVVELLRERDIPCDVCPVSNVALRAVPDEDSHPLARMIAERLTVTLGSDDPAMFHTDLVNEYRFAWERCGLREEVLGRLALNSIERAFASERKRRTWMEEWEDWVRYSRE